MTELRAKLPREDEINEDDRCAKIKRHDIDIAPTADVDNKLAEKLDSLLKINISNKRRFKTNKPRSDRGDESRTVSDAVVDGQQSTLKQRNLTKEELRERLVKKYDTLVPELDPKRTSVRVVEVLSANESIELGKDQARKQLHREMELNSVSGNQLAYKKGLQSFKFNDGYELTMKNFATKNTKQNQSATSGLSSALRDNRNRSPTVSKSSKSVGFASAVSYRSDERYNDESDCDDDDDDDELTESDCSTVDD